MKILVTGHLGYLGKVLCPLLEEAGHQFTGLDLGLYEADPSSLKGIGDVRKLRLDADVDAVIHLAAIVGEPACDEYRQMARTINVHGSEHVIKECRRTGAALIFASTCSVYGAADHVLFENSALKPLGAYAKDRLIAEKIAIANQGVALRFGTLFGWSERMRFDLVINKWCADAHQGLPIEVHGGRQWRPFLHVEDAARSILWALEAMVDDADDVRGEVFNVASTNSTILELANTIRRHAKLKVKVLQNVTDMRDYRISTSKIESLRWHPFWTVEKGVSQILNRLSECLIDAMDPIHSNLESLRRRYPEHS